MSTTTPALSDELREYMLSVSLRESEILRELRAETSRMQNSNMQISPEQGQFMNFLVKLTGTKKTLEIGVFTGYSSLWTAMALPDDGKMIACDISDLWTDTARKYWRLAGVEHKIDLRLAPAEETLGELIGSGMKSSFDFAFIDADKNSYDIYYELCLELIKTGGLILLDNVFRHGSVTDSETVNPGAIAIRELNSRLLNDSRVDISMLPLSDGLTLIRKR